MLSEKEKEGCKDILQLLPDDEVMALAQTTTAHQLSLTGRQEAVDAVVMFTVDAENFLKRKKLKRGYLFRYVAMKGITITASAEKYKLKQVILEHWGSNANQVGSVVNGATQAITLPPLPEQHQSQPATQQQQQYQLAHHRPHTERQVQPAQPCNQGSTQQNQGELQQFGSSFVKWFYTLLNSLNPTSGLAANTSEDFGAHHFYPDCVLQLLCATTELQKMEYSGAELAAKRLRALVSEEQLLLSPNLSTDGMRMRSDPHGLREVLVCGTVHQNNCAVGIFEQQFRLIQEPVHGCWKIKNSNLKLRTQAGLEGMPTLQHTSQMMPIDTAS